MKKINRIVFLFEFVLLISLVLNPTKEIITKNKEVNASNDSNVSTRELAMLASLVYENVPNDSNYVGNTANLGCSVDKSTGAVGSGCKFIALESQSASNLKLKGSKYNVWQYIEGLSERKMSSLVSMATATFREDGQKYYFLNFADTSEMENWEIVHYGAKETSILSWAGIDFDWDGEFYAITFKKGNNYVIAYRGTDFPDLFEWLQDVAYALNGEHKQAKLAYSYAQSEYDRILSENPNANIYVTGHSLGAYLAQVGGAAIIDKEAGITDPNVTPNSFNSLNDYTTKYKSVTTSKLKQVAYFNGMGVGGIFTSNNFTKNIDNALVYLSTHTQSGNLANTGRYVNYSKDKTKIQSSGRLVLYSMDADPVSDIGLHYGEIYKLELGADAITNHHNTHSSKLGELLQNAASLNVGGLLSELEKLYDNKFIASISENLYSIIKSNQAIDSKFNYIPTIVEESISKENNNITIANYGVGSLLSNLTKDVKDFAANYKQKGFEITNIFDHFNMNHETDSFTCLIDSENGRISKEEIVIEASSGNYACEGDTCYLNDEYVDDDYGLGDDVYNSNGKNIVLTAHVNGGCAKTYTWYVSNNNVDFSKIGETVRNKIIVPRTTFKLEENSIETLYFKVEVNYGDSYKETKLKLDNDLVLEYDRKDSKQVNPTLNDGISSSSGNVESGVYQLKVVYDKTAPVCEFRQEVKNVTLEKNIIGIVKQEEVEVSLECTDDLSGFSLSNANVSFDNFEMDVNTGFGLAIARINKDKQIRTEISGKTMKVYVPVTVLRKPSGNTAKLYYNVNLVKPAEVKQGIKDKAGNASTNKDSISFNITTSD